MLAQPSSNFASKLFGQLRLQTVLIIFLVLPVTAIICLVEFLSYKNEPDINHLIFLGLVLLILATIHSIAIARWVTIPIWQLNAVAEAIGQGRWDKAVTINHFYELVRLAESFNRISVRLQDMSENAEQRVQQRTAQLLSANKQLQRELAECKQTSEGLALENARLLETLDRYERIMSSLPDGIALLDRDYVYQVANQTYLKLNDKSREQVEGHSVSDLLGPKEFEKGVKKQMDRALAGETAHYPAWVESPALGRRFISTIFSSYHELDNTISGVVVSSRDITEFELLAGQLRQTQKQEALGQLAAGVAHHFNNILTVIMGNVDLSLYELPSHHPIAENLERVQAITHRAAHMVWQILAFAGKQLIRPQIINLNEWLLKAEPRLKQLVPASIELHALLAPDLGTVKVDVNQFEYLLVHLIKNAQDAMPKGGQLTLTTANISQPLDPDNQSAEVPPGDYALLTVSDTGVGLTEEEKAHLFEPFFTTKEVGQGTGLGLATCFGIVKQHGGYIIVDSQPGRGAAFKIYLPHLP